jgi:hypothetical protein
MLMINSKYVMEMVIAMVIENRYFGVITPGNHTNCNTLYLPLPAITQQGHLNHPEDHPGQ